MSTAMSALQTVLEDFRSKAQTEREKGTYFEELILCYLRHEPLYKDLYSDVWTYAEWAKTQNMDQRDTGIDLVTKVRDMDNEYHAIQCKFYAADYTVQKRDIDSFFTASGKRPFTHRIIVSTTNHWGEHAEDALRGQQPPVSKIDLHDLENSQIDWSQYHGNKRPVLKAKKEPRPHQSEALNKVIHGLKEADRGKLIMACGTGKTFVSLKIAEKQAGAGKRVLFLVPSLALLSQALTEWTQESKTPLHSFAVCSDSDVGKKRKKDDDRVQTFMHELRYPATTDAKRLAQEMSKKHDAQHMSIVFSTYHSIACINEAQKKHKLADFDLIICDEAHRTTGATFESEEESAFVRVHDNKYIRAAKRLYMTATPRIYGDKAKASAEKDNVVLCSMDDETLYGKELYVLTFSEAVKRGLLTDYKVIVLSVAESHINHRLQNLFKDENNQLKVDDAAKIVGCWKAMAKQGLKEELPFDPKPMQRAVAFCQVIEIPKGGRTHKVSSKQIAAMFKEVVDAYRETADEDEDVSTLMCEARHVDGSMNASEKEEKIDWLKAEPPANTCRILSNVRCLSEGVDVPALDAVLFLTPRNSQVDVVQSVGRVMRIKEGKTRGYIVLPVVIPAGVEPHEALNDNKTYAVVWQVLQALRSHDDRFDAMINKLDLIGSDPSRMEVIAITDTIQKKQKKRTEKTIKDPHGSYDIGSPAPAPTPHQPDLQFEIGEIERAIYAKLVQKVGNRHHWEDWAKDIAKIARTHIDRIQAILDNPNNTKERKAFDAFAEELRDDLNASIGDDEIIEMLAQHLITQPVFDTLFQSYEFTKRNSISKAMQKVLNTLQEHHLEKEADTLQSFYDSVKLRAEGIDNAAGKQKIIVELYDKFFRNAFPKMAARLGIIYTRVEIVDFIINSVNDVLRNEFGKTLGSKNIHILDLFTGTGTFITRLLQSGLISEKELPYKYKNEIHANEIVLLAYYIAAINIESTYHDLVKDNYLPFEGICLTDTFELYEKDDMVSDILEDNSNRRKRQKKLDIRVIVGNPPYSSGQKSANDNNANTKYPALDSRIADTYTKNSLATLQNKLYDPYIRAIRWASDRIKDAGVIGFVTNAGWVDGRSMDGIRKCLAEEFSSIHVFHLRGNARTSGEQRRKERDNVFDDGTRAPIVISILVKNPQAQKQGKIYFHDIGDYLTREEKLKAIADFGSIDGITQKNGWQTITPDKYYDWINQRDDRFYDYISMGDKKNKTAPMIFESYSLGVATNRDHWVYNFSKNKLCKNVQTTIDFYNAELQRYQGLMDKVDIDSFISSDHTEISWTRALKNDLKKGRALVFCKKSIAVGLYRPFTKQNLYFNRQLNEMVLLVPSFFPTAKTENLAICLTGLGTPKEFSTIVVDCIPDIQLQANGQCFPLYLYDKPRQKKKGADDLFDKGSNTDGEYVRRDAITNTGLAHFQKAYPKEKISKEDVFYYIYGLLHSEDYRNRYADNLTKELPRIPCVRKAADFWAFSKAGRQLAKLHLNYENVPLYPVNFKEGKLLLDTMSAKDFYVEKMRFGKTNGKTDKTIVNYNAKITMTDIPLEAYDYIVNGKPALEWVMERQAVTTHTDSGIVNDANDWAIETMKNARYPLELFQRVITVSLETMKIVRALPPLDI